MPSQRAPTSRQRRRAPLSHSTTHRAHVSSTVRIVPGVSAAALLPLLALSRGATASAQSAQLRVHRGRASREWRTAADRHTMATCSGPHRPWHRATRALARTPRVLRGGWGGVSVGRRAPAVRAGGDRGSVLPRPGRAVPGDQPGRAARPASGVQPGSWSGDGGRGASQSSVLRNGPAMTRAAGIIPSRSASAACRSSRDPRRPAAPPRARD